MNQRLSWLPSCLASVLPVGRQQCNGQPLRRRIENEFQSADVAAIDAVGFWRVAIVADFGLAGRALHGIDAPRKKRERTINSAH